MTRPAPPPYRPDRSLIGYLEAGQRGPADELEARRLAARLAEAVDLEVEEEALAAARALVERRHLALEELDALEAAIDRRRRAFHACTSPGCPECRGFPPRGRTV